jgi:hypothetical protein
MESANRVLTRNALELLKSIAVGEYKSPEERAAEMEAVASARDEKANEAEMSSPTAEIAREEEATVPEGDAGASSEEATKN